MSMFENGLEKNPANYVALTPITFIERAAAIHPERLSVIHGTLRLTWRQSYERARRLASALAKRGIGHGDTVAVMLPNIPAMIDVHFGVPMAGAVLNTLNTRLDACAIAYMLEHGEAAAVIVDREFSAVMQEALAGLPKRPLVIDVDDPEFNGPGERIGDIEYESFLADANPEYAWMPPADEWNAIGLNYTSGTTGLPKGVVVHHRGAYLNAVSNILAWPLPRHPVYLWTLPMFHCNGWCFPWTVAAQAGVNVCLRRVDAALIWAAIRDYRVTHYCGAPIVHNLILHADPAMRAGVTHRVSAMVAGAAPPPAMIEGLDRIGFELVHVYGLTEVYGPTVVCEPHEDWATLGAGERAALNARQGVRYPLQECVTVVDPETLQPVPADGETIGEIVFRGNITMKGYLKNPDATQAAFKGGWFHSGDLGVLCPDGYIKIKDRSKDIIISGGENISSIEVEDVLYRHPAVMAAAVVAMPHDKWGETPCAFVELKAQAHATEQELIEHCRRQLAGFKVPRVVIFGELPKTSTGKIQKFELRQRVRSTQAIDP
ncbi:acyl-CoA synthetase [Noviherbaspirillum aerium]|uniref:acyl-CoA synthetase n=1 Tax=Noviherbaspirillum aerium TaxID=2588497 RepID=UPI00124E6CB0|nr:acyl-CoA synthetase [Noviherbaspirillum aerium]